jgi:hypothetical protein
MRLTSVCIASIACLMAAASAYLRLLPFDSAASERACVEVTPPTLHVTPDNGSAEKTITVRNTSTRPVLLAGGSFGCFTQGCVVCKAELPLEIPAGGQCELPLSISFRQAKSTNVVPGPTEYTLDLYVLAPHTAVVPVRMVFGGP